MKTSSILIGLLLIISSTAFADPIEEGKAIFMNRCAACHNVNKVLTGPALAGVDQRHSIDWITNFVHSSTKMVTSGDPKAVAIFEKFNRIPMPDHPDLTKADITKIVEYIKTESKPVEENVAPFAKPTKLQPKMVPLSSKNLGFFGTYLLIVSLLIFTLLFAVKARGLRG